MRIKTKERQIEGGGYRGGDGELEGGILFITCGAGSVVFELPVCLSSIAS